MTHDRTIPPTPRQLHHFVGDLFALGGNLQCVRPIDNKFGRGKNAWAMLFPVIAYSYKEQSIFPDFYFSAQARIGRLGKTHWSLRVVNSTDEIDEARSTPSRVVTQEDGHADTLASFKALQITSVRHRTIAKFIWDMSGVFVANVTSRTFVDDGKNHPEASIPKEEMPELHNPLLSEPDSARQLTAFDVATMRQGLLRQYAEMPHDNQPRYRTPLSQVV